MSAPIEGKITNIIDDMTVAINRGSNHGVEKGMKFTVGGQEIKIQDPDTNEELGSLTYIKVRIEVTKVYEKFSLARSYETVYQSPLPFPSYFTSRVVTKKLPLETIPEFEKNVQIGDTVVQIKEEDQETSQES